MRNASEKKVQGKP